MVLPNFLICGTQRGGTTSLARYLMEHPEICIPRKKEIHFFDLNYERGIKWYERQFRACKKDFKAIGEASPFYMYLESVPERIHSLLPDVKLIFILRNPVDRAYSHYWYEVKLGFEYLSFEEAIMREEERLARGDLFSKQHYSYLDRGKYVIQLERFLEYFPREQMLILMHQDLLEKPDQVMRQIFEFLAVDSDFRSPNWKLKRYNVGGVPTIWALQRLGGLMGRNIFAKGMRYLISAINLKRGYPPMEQALRRKLIEYYRSYNEKLEKFLDKGLESWF